jgi:hypothetical protein
MKSILGILAFLTATQLLCTTGKNESANELNIYDENGSNTLIKDNQRLIFNYKTQSYERKKY